MIEPAWMLGAFLTLTGLIAGCYAYVRAVDVRETDLRKTLEDLLESKLSGVQVSLDKFIREVIDRLARIETKVEDNRRAPGER